MSQDDFIIANQGFPAFRSDLNSNLQALASTSSGATAPSTTYANQLWYDTANDILKIRNEANSAWINVITLDQTNNKNSSITVPTIDSGTSTALTLKSGTTTAMTIDTSQNVGIGTTSPAKKLHVNGDIRLGDGGGTGAIFTDATNGLRFMLPAAGTSNTESMRLDSSGNLGIGTSSPANNAGYQTLTINGTSGGVAQIQVAGTNTFQIFSNATANYLNGQTALPMAFLTNATERMRIDSSGNVFVGTTTSYGRFTVVPTTTQYSFASNAPNSSGTYYHFHCLAAGTTVGTIASTSTTTTYGTSSDYRLKHGVQTMTSGLATIVALKPVTYKWNIDDSIGEGFIAHELAEHIPLAVVGEKDAINEDGSINAQSVDYSKIVVHLVAAIQELSAKVDAQAAEIATFKETK